MKNKHDAKQQAEVKNTSSSDQIDAKEKVEVASDKTAASDSKVAEKDTVIEAQSPSLEDERDKSLDVNEPETVDEKASPSQESSSLEKDTIEDRPEVATPNNKAKVSKLAVLCLILILLLGAGGSWAMYNLYKVVNTEQDSISELAASHAGDVSATKRQLEQQNSLHDSQLSRLSDKVSQQIARQQQTINMLQDKMVELAGRRPNDWLLAEANYLVKLAGRKLWQEKDISTASTLLTTADIRIAEMNDPSLISIRQALASDIASLQALPRDNSETLALKIDGLISQVDNLKLNMVELPELAEAQVSGELSNSATDWQDNLKRMWHSFSDGFITVRRRNGSVEPLISPKQQWYLEENLKSKLMQTQIAVYRQQQDAFEHSIELSTRWIMQFYDRQDSTTEFMLSELDSLKGEKISISYPQKLSSSNLIIDELLQRNIGYDNKAGR